MFRWRGFLGQLFPPSFFSKSKEIRISSLSKREMTHVGWRPQRPLFALDPNDSGRQKPRKIGTTSSPFWKRWVVFLSLQSSLHVQNSCHVTWMHIKWPRWLMLFAYGKPTRTRCFWILYYIYLSASITLWLRKPRSSLGSKHRLVVLGIDKVQENFNAWIIW